MITKVSHQSTVRGPADVTLALSIASALHQDTPAARAPEVATTPVPELMGLRVSAARPHRRKVPLRRLNTMRSLSALAV
ncbi:hypothetical protein GCM10010503_47940 [Streptomyces lucensis JCM 4490]|uniref:Uncharacterized protein n=1 Tax=Streptomyces lucensis JCM 4490 TaxID=1306176 RepID=A0A918J9G9_9ACTN|nr:hypothetical protein [Streptomyces lucensis]GGW65332.1 hypothetical protein GCM10010503_47940 [Streptomyces lucensis JCM 4490]